MKSFAAKVRDALTREETWQPGAQGVHRAELSGLLLSCGNVSIRSGGGFRVSFRMYHAGTCRRTMKLLRETFSIRPGICMYRVKRLGGRTSFEVSLEGEEAKAVLEALEIAPLNPSIPGHCKQSQRRRAAFLRGIFLGTGSITAPEQSYQMEFVLESEAVSGALCAFLRRYCQVQAGVSARKQRWVVYLRSAEGIIAVLSAIGAHSAILDIENVRITKDARNRANRASNCDSGNIAKMVGAVERQLQAIDTVEKHLGLDALPETLREIAIERRLHADISLEQLGMMLNPPLGKSGVNHRLNRIVALAQTLDDQ